MNNEEKLQLYSCIKRQFTDPGLYKSSRIYEWLFTNGFSLEKLGYNSFDELCSDFPEVFMFQEDKNSEFVLIKKWQTGENNLLDGFFNGHPADNFFGTRNVILNDDIIEMTQQSLYALTKILGCGYTVQQMKQEVFRKFEEAKQSNKLDFFGEKYIFPIDYCQDGQLVNGIVTKNLNTLGKSLYFSFEKTRIFRSASVAAENKTVTAEIPEEEEKRIYALLSGNFPLNQQIHMAAVSKYLTDHGVDRMKFGFYKMKDFLSKFSFLELKEIILGGVPQILVTIRDVNSDKISAESLAERAQQKSTAFAVSEKTDSSKVPAGKLSDFCNLPIKPMSILEKHIEDSGEKTDFFELSAALNEDFDEARKNNAVFVYSNKIIFPCRFRKCDGTNIELTLKPNTYEGKGWFLYFVDTIVRENRNSAISSGKQLENFAFLGSWSAFLSELSSMAAYEEWDFKNSTHKNYQILIQYIKFTFCRLMREKKVCISHNKQFAAFNTGLADKNYDDIYACFIPNENGDTEWKFIGFCTAFSSGLGRQLVDNFNPLPQPPVYFTRNEDLFFDSEKNIHIDFENLILDNIQRLPLYLLNEQFFDNQEGRGIVEKIRFAKDRFERSELYEELKELISANSRLFLRIQNCLKYAIELAKKRAKWNFKTAFPAYFPKRDAISFMLPLALRCENKPDVALVVEYTHSGSYQAQTILTLSQAYIDARLVCKLSDDWLSAEKISDNIQDEHLSSHCEEIN